MSDIIGVATTCGNNEASLGMSESKSQPPMTITFLLIHLELLQQPSTKSNTLQNMKENCKTINIFHNLKQKHTVNYNQATKAKMLAKNNGSKMLHPRKKVFFSFAV